MTRQEQLLVILMEECAEVTQRASKALRFGLTDPTGTEPNQPYTNKDRLLMEVNDLYAVIEMVFDSEGRFYSPMLIQDKKEKVEKYLKLSEKLGILG